MMSDSEIQMSVTYEIKSVKDQDDNSFKDYFTI